MPDPTNYYLARRPRYLRQFDQIASAVRPVLDRYFDPQGVPELIAETRREFHEVIPQLPYVGSDYLFTQFVLFTGMFLAIYRISKERQKTTPEIGEMSYEISKAYIKSFPLALMQMFGPINFSRYYLSRLQKKAFESHQRKYPDGYVYDFVPGDGKSFDYGVDYLECASCKFFARQGASDFAPYLCPVDILYSNAFGWGLMRTQTIAEGAPRCDFRFKKGGPTRVAVPSAMKSVVER